MHFHTLLCQNFVWYKIHRSDAMAKKLCDCSKKKSLCYALNEWKSHILFALFEKSTNCQQIFVFISNYVFHLHEDFTQIPVKPFYIQWIENSNRNFFLFNMNAWIYGSILCECYSMIWKFIAFFLSAKVFWAPVWVYRFNIN